MTVIRSGLPISERRNPINLVRMMGLTGHQGGLQMDAMLHFALTKWVLRNCGFGIKVKINSGELAINRLVQYTTLRCRSGHQMENILLQNYVLKM